MTGQALCVLRKDLLLERRGKANLNALLFLAGLILVIVSFALGPSQARLSAAAPGILWIAFAFAGVLAFARAYQSESENGCFEGMLLAGADPKAIYLGKLTATVLVMLLMEAVVTAAMSLLYNLRLWTVLPALALVAVLGSVGIASIGVLYGRLTMSTRAREVMLPLLMLPVVIPVLLASVRASTILFGGSTTGLGLWLELLTVFDMVFLTAGLLTFGTLCEE